LPAGATPSPKEATRDNKAWKNTGSAAYNLKSVSLDFGQPLTPKVDFYGSASYAYRTSSADQNYRPPARNEVIRAIYPDGFTPIEAIQENDFEVTSGLKGRDLAGWDWDFSGTFGRDDVDVYTRNSNNPTYGLLSPTDFYDGANIFAASTINFDLRRSFELGAIPLDVAFGGELRHENFQITPGETASWADGGIPVLDGPNKGLILVGKGGAQALPGFRPGDATDVTRDSRSAYASASSRLTSNFLVDLAGRYENYSDFGDTLNGRVSSRYDFGKFLGVRGTISNGFHAPALAAENYRNTANINTYIQHTIAVESPEARALGAEPLKAETSRNYTIGLVSEPLKSVFIAVDAFQIDLENLITQSTSIRDAIYPGTKALITAAGFAPEDSVNFFINGVNTRTRGIEVTLEQVTKTVGFGDFRWTLAAARSYTAITSTVPTPAILAQYNVPLFAASNATNITYQGPRNKLILGVNWTKNRFNVSLHETYYGPIERLGTPTTVATSGPYAGLTAIPTGNPAEWVTDFDLTYRITKSLSASVSVNNLFNVKPGKVPDPLLSANQTYAYNNFGPLGASGGFYSTTLRYSF
jgi:iron complex outermembrane receptor protein